MKAYQKKEIEHVSHSTISKINFFIVDLTYRGMHAHSDLEILLLLEGTAHITTPKEEFNIQCGDVVLFNSNQAHSCYAVEGPCYALVIQIDLSFCVNYYPAIRNIRFNTSNLFSVIPDNKKEELKETCFNLGYNYYGELPAFEFRCMSDVNRLFSFFLTYIPYQIVSDEEYTNNLIFEKRMERILHYVREHYIDKITLAEIADQEGLTTSYLSHFFKDYLHQNFQTYVNSLRFEHALYLLTKTDLRIIDICLQSGFSDSKYLNKMFLQIYGVTPKEFRAIGSEMDLTNLKKLSNEEDEEYILPKEEGLAILRSNFLFPCDDGTHPNSIE